MSEQSIVVIVTGAVTIVSLWLKSHYDRLAVEATTKTATSKTAAGVQLAVDEVDKIRVMVDGQRTAMLEQLKMQTIKITDLERVIASQRETAVAVAATAMATPKPT